MLHSRHIQLIKWCALIFGILFLVLSFYNVPATDDYHFLHNLHQFGIWNGMIHEYNSWSPRFASVLMTHLFLRIQDSWGIGYLLFGILSLVLVTFSVYSFLRMVDTHLSKVLLFSFRNLKPIDQISIALFISSIWFLGTFRIGETWFWLCSASTYLWSNAFFMILISRLFKKYSTTFDYPVLVLCAYYIGGSCGPISLITLTILGILLFSTSSKNNYLFDLNASLLRRKIVFSLVVLGGFFLIQYLAEGNRIRETFFQRVSLMGSLVLNMKMTGIILIKRLPLSLLIDLILTFPVVGIVRTKNKAEPKKWFKTIFLVTFSYFMAIFLFQWSITYKTQDVGAFRTLFFVQTLTLLYCGVFWMLAAKFGVLHKIQGIQHKIGSGILTIYLIVLSAILIKETTVTKRYHQACIGRVSYVKQSCNAKNVVEVNPLPESGMLYSSELSTDTAYFSNVHFKQGLNLNCTVKRKLFFPE